MDPGSSKEAALFWDIRTRETKEEEREGVRAGPVFWGTEGTEESGFPSGSVMGADGALGRGPVDVWGGHSFVVGGWGRRAGLSCSL